METEDYKQKILTGTVPDGYYLGPKTEDTPGDTGAITQELAAGYARLDKDSDPPIAIAIGGVRTPFTQDHEFVHSLQFLKRLREETDREKEGAPTGMFKGLRPPKGYAKEFERLQSSEISSERDEAIGFAKAYRIPSEGVAYLVSASRVFGLENGRPPSTEKEVLRALDLAIDRAVKAGKWISVGAFEGLKRLPWARKVGKYLVENNSPDEGGMKYV